MASLLFLSVLGLRLSAQNCTPPFGYSYTNQKVSEIPGGPNWTAGSTISITGKLTIDQSVTLNDLDFVMSPNASIEITGSGTVVTATNGTQFYGCTQMWLGITVVKGATILFNSGTTLVKDAWIGLRFTDGANGTNSQLVGVNFFNNHHGIAIFSMGSAASPFRFANFSGNTIKSGPPPQQSTLLPAPTSHPYAGSRPFRGIWIIQSNANLEFGAAAQNRIEDCRYGMAVFSSTVTIANMRFRNNRSDAAIADANSGTDILSSESFLVVSGATPSNCIFQSAERFSILSMKTRALTVTGAEFYNPGKYGIRSIANNFAALLNIRDNSFEMEYNKFFVSAIFIERPPGNVTSTDALIRDNTVYVIFPQGAPKQHGAKVLIDVIGKQDAFNNFDIESNTLTVNTKVDSIHGIRVTGKGDDYHIWEQNELTWWLAGTPTKLNKSLGIIAKDLTGSGQEVSGNVVESALTSGGLSFLNAGIQLGNVPSFLVRVCENDVDDTHLGLECLGKLDLTWLKRNKMGNAAYGLLCRADAMLDEQFLHENIWDGTSYTTMGARHLGTPTKFFFYDPSATISDDAPPTWSPVEWFDDDASGSNGSCFPTGTVPPITGRESDFIIGTAVPDTATANWDERRHLLYKLMRYPTLTEGNTNAATYLNSNATANTSAWQFARAEWLFDQAYKVSATTATSLGSLSAHYRAVVDNIMAYDVQQAQDTTTYDFSIAQNRTGAFATLCQVADSIKQQLSVIEPSINTALSTARTYAESLPTGKAYESNLKNILVIAIRYAQGDSLTETDYNSLRSIAAKCPQYNGISIRRAPLWLPHEEAVEYITKTWEEECIERSTESSRVASEVLKVMPNPANDRIQVIFPNDVTSGRWQVNDVTGRLVQEGNIADAALSIGTADWKSGIYILICHSGSGKVSSTKFVVAH
ncbi:MAG: hypothetical protein OHK0019_31090 [Saprospiraceae bacterium]